MDMKWLYYVGTVILKMTEAEFRSCSPKKLFSLIRQHSKFINPPKKEERKTTSNGVEKNVIKGETNTLRRIK